MINQFNTLCFWIVSEIVVRVRIEERKLLIQKVVDVTHFLVHLRDYFGAKALYTALCHPAVSRMEKVLFCFFVWFFCLVFLFCFFVWFFCFCFCFCFCVYLLFVFICYLLFVLLFYLFVLFFSSFVSFFFYSFVSLSFLIFLFRHFRIDKRNKKKNHKIASFTFYGFFKWC